MYPYKTRSDNRSLFPRLLHAEVNHGLEWLADAVAIWQQK